MSLVGFPRWQSGKMIHLPMQEMQGMRVQSLCWEDPLEEEVEAHSKQSCLENPTDRGARWAAVHGTAESQGRLGT